MNDRFKFRVWDQKNSEYVPVGKMVDVHCLLHRDGTLDCGIAYDDGYARSIDWVETDDAVIEQCTGLKDKNGNLIYEGDILVDKNGLHNPVSFVDGSFVFTHLKAAVFPLKQEIADTFEIIGNIHEEHFRKVTKMVEAKPCQG